MRIFLISILVLATAGIAAVIALPWLISSETVRSSLLERAREVTGREMRFSGDPRVSFSPFLGIEIQDVVFSQPDTGEEEKPILSMPFLRAKLNVTSALAGAVTIDEFQFIQPKFNLKYFANGNTSWTFPNGKVWKALQEARTLRTDTPTGSAPNLAKLTNIKLGLFSVEGGTINYENELSGRTETVTNFNGSLQWPNTRAGWTFDGNGIWRGDEVNLDLTAATPIMLLAGGSTKLKLQANSDTIKFDFDGEANRFSDLFINGAVETSSPSLRKMVAFFGGQSGVGSSFLTFAATGNLSGTLSDIQLEGAALDLDGNQYSGGLRLILDSESNNQLSGTLATTSLELSPYLASFQAQGGFDSTMEFLDQTELDLRLSAASVAIEKLTLSDFAGGLVVKDDIFKLDVGNAAIGEGLLSGNVQISNAGEQLETTLSIDAGGIDLDAVPLLKSYIGIVPSGSSDLKLRLTSVSETFDTFKNQMNGEFSMSMRNGELIGLNFNNIRSSLRNGVESGENFKIGNFAGQTNIGDFMLNVIINRGVGWIQNSSFSIEEFEANLTGKADLRSGNLGIWGDLKNTDETETFEGSQFLLGGTMAQPLYVPQPSIRSPEIIGPSKPIENTAPSSGSDSGTN